MPRLTKAEKERNAAIVALAKLEYNDEGTCEIDDNAKVSEGDDNGAYVEAWVWVDFSGTAFDKEPAEDEQ